MNRAILAANAATMVETLCGHGVPAGDASRSRRARRPSPLRSLAGAGAGVAFLLSRFPVYGVVLILTVLASLAGLLLYITQVIGLRLLRVGGTLATLGVAACCLALPHPARAAMVTPQTLMAQASYVTGTQTSLTSFDVPGAGTLSVSVNDIDFPTPLQSLTASILGNGAALGSWSAAQGSDSGQFNVAIPTAGVFDAFVTAVAGEVGQGFSMGTYGIRVAFTPSVSPVPLPAALDLLLGGLALLGALSAIERIRAPQQKRHVATLEL